MSGIYVLLMIFAMASSHGGAAVVQQEFSNYENCEVARKAMAQAHQTFASELRVQGCFKK